MIHIPKHVQSDFATIIVTTCLAGGLREAGMKALHDLADPSHLQAV